MPSAPAVYVGSPGLPGAADAPVAPSAPIASTAAVTPPINLTLERIMISLSRLWIEH